MENAVCVSVAAEKTLASQISVNMTAPVPEFVPINPVVYGNPFASLFQSPWSMLILGALLCGVAFFVYTHFKKNDGTQGQQQQGQNMAWMQQNMAMQQQQQQAEMMRQAIQQQEQAKMAAQLGHSNPNDPYYNKLFTDSHGFSSKQGNPGIGSQAGGGPDMFSERLNQYSPSSGGEQIATQMAGMSPQQVQIASQMAQGGPPSQGGPSGMPPMMMGLDGMGGLGGGLGGGMGSTPMSSLFNQPMAA